MIWARKRTLVVSQRGRSGRFENRKKYKKTVLDFIIQSLDECECAMLSSLINLRSPS
jgi:hypothetical protein